MLRPQALARAQQDKTFAESLLSQQVAAWQASQTGHNPETLEQQLIALQAHLTTLQSSYTDDYPDVIKAKNDIAALQTENRRRAKVRARRAEAARARRYRSSRRRSNSFAPRFTATT